MRGMGTLTESIVADWSLEQAVTVIRRRTMPETVFCFNQGEEK